MAISSDDLQRLAQLTERDEHGVHFTVAEEGAWLARMEEAGMIRIIRPIHKATGIPYSQEHWRLEITDEAIADIEMEAK